MTLIAGSKSQKFGHGGLQAALAACLVAALTLGGGAVHAQTTTTPPPQKLSTVTLGAGLYNIKAEVARTPKEHEIGLMSRTSMGANEGMIFVFPRAGQQCFWMKNTLIPLSIAFLADDGRVVNIDEMQPQTETTHCSREPVRLVLEMNKGWFSKRGIKAGDKITGSLFGTPR